jgi:catechol 2,3-dioxygenase-like lactoylglutathione lyase family enzyme
MPIPTLGLSHVSLAVRDPQRSLDFYARAFGVREYFRDDDQIQGLGPGPHDVLAFVRDATAAGRPGGIGHFGFRLAHPDDIDAVVAGALAAGATLLRRGEFAPGLPFAHVADPDGYEIELWFEPAPLDRAAHIAAEPAPAIPYPTPAPAADAPRRPLDTGVLAYRCLKRLPGYTRVADAIADPDDWMGALVGTYRNPGTDGVVVSIQDRGLRWQGGAQRLYAAYADIVRIDRPGGETTETLTLVLADGQRFSLPVRGRAGRFCDSAAMLRVLGRVRAAADGDAAPIAPPPASA